MKLVEAPTMIAASGNPPKQIEEYVRRLNTGNFGPEPCCLM